MKRAKSHNYVSCNIARHSCTGVCCNLRYRFREAGAASQIKQGLDLAGGVSITYQVVGDEDPF